MSKFVTMLSASNQDIKSSRAEMIAEETVIEVNQFVSILKKEKMLLKNKIVKLTDLAPDNTYSLRPGGKDFNPTKWVQELHQTKMDLKLKEIELAEAESILTEWFSEETTTTNEG